MEHLQTGPDVTVTIDRTSKTIHRGSYTIPSLKDALGVPAALALDVVQDGQLVTLDEGGRFTIKGGEEFFSHARTGGSSHDVAR